MGSNVPEFLNRRVKPGDDNGETKRREFMSPRKAALTPANKTALGWIKEREPWLSQAHAHIWNLHETAWREYRSAAYYVQLLREHGFEVEEGSAAMPTAFFATCAPTWSNQAAGRKGPTIATYAEYDAVPGNS